MNSTKGEGKDGKDSADGCLKTIGIIAAAILIIIVIGGALEGIGEIFSRIPWYGHIVLMIGFAYLVIKFSGN